MQAEQAASLAVQAGATGGEGQKHVKQALVRLTSDGAAESLTGRGQAVPPQNRFKSLHIHRRVHRTISPAMLRRVADGLPGRFFSLTAHAGGTATAAFAEAVTFKTYVKGE